MLNIDEATSKLLLSAMAVEEARTLVSSGQETARLHSHFMNRTLMQMDLSPTCWKDWPAGRSRLCATMLCRILVLILYISAFIRYAICTQQECNYILGNTLLESILL